MADEADPLNDEGEEGEEEEEEVSRRNHDGRGVREGWVGSCACTRGKGGRNAPHHTASRQQTTTASRRRL